MNIFYVESKSKMNKFFFSFFRVEGGWGGGDRCGAGGVAGVSGFFFNMKPNFFFLERGGWARVSEIFYKESKKI